MSQTLVCPHCKSTIEISEAITAELEEKVIKEHEKQHQLEIERLLEEKKQIESTAEKRLDEAKKSLESSIRKETLSKLREEYSHKIENIETEAKSREEQNRELRTQLAELLKQNREMKAKDDQREIEFQKKLIEETDSLKNKAKQEVLEETQLQMAQKEKQLEDLRKQLSEAQRKAEQGSQQTQGEVQELILEDMLRSLFPMDEIKEVPKGIEGADVIQVVKTNAGVVCGTIVWESKNTKAWSPGWLTKLKTDQRSLKAEIAVIISKVLPDEIKTFGNIEGVWVSDLTSASGLALALRQQLIQVLNAKAMSANMASKAEIVYDYLTSNNFKQRIEVWVEYFKQRKEEIDKERAYFVKKWEKEEKSIHLVFDNTVGIYGDLQGLIGNALPKVNYLELDEAPEESPEN